MARTKTEKNVAAAAEVKPEDATPMVELQAENGRLAAENTALHAENESLRLHIEQLEALARMPSADAAGSGAAVLPEYAAGTNPPADDAEVVAVKSKHGHPFWRAGYQVQKDWTFVCRADFDPGDFARLTGDRMVVVREAVRVAQ